MSAGGAVDVAALIRRGAASCAPDPLEAVMGEDWALLGPGEGRAAALMRLHHLMGGQAARERSRSLPSGLEIVTGGRAAMVKLIGKGGAKDRAGLARQMAYLGREGEVPLQRSERYFGASVEPEDFEAFAASWGLTAGMRAAPDGADRTSHFLVSFPPGTDEGAAERAGRAWAEAMFAEGRFGDVWDYYTAFHTDRAHPHLHVVVNRRGLERGAWLKVSRRSEVNWDALRAVQVEAAAAEGIVLEATPRLARGVHARPATDAELRRAAREGRAARAPEHTPETALIAAATVLTFRRRYVADAALAFERHPQMAAALDALAQTLGAGRAYEAGVGEAGGGVAIPRQEAEAMAQTLSEQRRVVLANFSSMEREVAGLSDPAARARFERQTAAIKAEAALYMPDRPELVAFSEADAAGRYRGVAPGDDPRAREIAAGADRRVAALAREAGLDGAVTVARHGSDAAPPRALAEQWEREDRAAIARAIGAPDRALYAVSPDAPAVSAALATLRETIGAVYAHAAAEIVLARAERAALGETAARGGPITREGHERTARALAQLLSDEEKRDALAQGAQALRALTPDADGQRVLARVWLSAVADGASFAASGDAGDAGGEAARRAAAQARLAEIDAAQAARERGLGGKRADPPQLGRDAGERPHGRPDAAREPDTPPDGPRKPRDRPRGRDDDGHGL